MTRHGTYTPKRTRDYEARVRKAYEAAGGKLMDGRLAMHVHAVFPTPKSWPKKRLHELAQMGFWHTNKPDIDNVVKAVLDGLHGAAYEDDSCVVSLTAVKRYTKNKNELPGVLVMIAQIEEEMQ